MKKGDIVKCVNLDGHQNLAETLRLGSLYRVEKTWTQGSPSYPDLRVFLSTMSGEPLKRIRPKQERFEVVYPA